MERRLGKLPAKIDARTFKLEAVLKAEALPPLPDAFDIDAGLGVQMPEDIWGNDKWGDCVICGRANYTLRAEFFEQKKALTITSDDVLKEYWTEQGGGEPDNGLVMLDSLNEWRQAGWSLMGTAKKRCFLCKPKAALQTYTIDAFAALNVKDHKQLCYAVLLLSGGYLGIQVPQSAMDQFDAGQIWDVVPGSPIEGGHCFTGDTEVALLDGTEATMKELTERGGEFWVYSCDENGNIVPGKASRPRLTRRNARIVTITLDNGEVIRCTPDHRFLMRDGIYKEASVLHPGDSLMPLYRGKGQMGHETVLNPQTEQYILTHKLVANAVLGSMPSSIERIVIHHKDFNKFNNTPENLEYLAWSVHGLIHADHISEMNRSEPSRSRSRSIMESHWSDPVWSAKMREQLKVNLAHTGFDEWDKNKLRSQLHLKMTTASQRAARKQNIKACHTPEAIARRAATYHQHFKNDPNFAFAVAERARRNGRMAFNHKVASVSDAGCEDVYDFIVEKYHNFALSAGVFVHNCIYVVAYNDVGPICMTWGKRQQMTWSFLDAMCDEAYAIVDNIDSWVADDPLDVQKLQDYLDELQTQ